MNHKERRFIEIAVQLGYITQAQVASVYSLYKWHARNESKVDVSQICLQKEFLSASQVNEVINILKRETQSVPLQKRLPIGDNFVAMESMKESGDTLSGTVGMPMASDSSLDATKNLTEGKVWKDFQIIKKIGSGGMGVVYQAKQKAPERIVALKILVSGEVTQAQWKRFVKEAQLSAELVHPNIIKVYLADIYENIPYIAMSYVEGQPFEDGFQSEELSLEDKLTIVEKVARALDFAHSKGIIHRDIKPANILLEKNNNPILMDFGIARSTRVDDRALTKTGQVLGTPQYMAPEQAQGLRRQVDGRSDLYSLGIILYEIVTGLPAVQGDSPMEILFNAVSERPTPPRQIDSNISEDLEAIILKAIEEDPNKRYQTAGEFAEELRAFQEGKKVKAGGLLQKLRYLRVPRWIKTSGLVAATLLFCLAIYPLLSSTTPVEKEEVNINALYNEAMTAWKSNKLDIATRKVDHILGLEHTHVKSLHLRKEILKKQNQVEQIIVVITRLYEMSKDHKELENLGLESLKYNDSTLARKCFEKALTTTPSSQKDRLRKLLAATNLHSFRFPEAKKEYDSVTTPNDVDVLIGQSWLHYYNGDLSDAKKLLKNTALQSARAEIKLQVDFLNVLVLLEQQEKNFMKLDWLVPSGEDKSHAANVKTFLSRGIKKLNQVQEGLNQISERNFVLNRLQKQVTTYITALDLEKGDYTTTQTQEKIQVIQDLLKEDFIVVSKQTFLEKLIIRVLIKNQKWQESHQFANQVITKKPWENHFYHLQSINSFHLKDINSFSNYFRKAHLVAPSDFMVVRNSIELLFQRLSQDEFDAFYDVCIKVFSKPPPDLMRAVLRRSVEELRKAYLDSPPPSRRYEMSVEQADSMIRKVLESKSAPARQAAMSFLQTQYKNKKVVGRVREFSKLRNNEDLQTLMENMQKQRIKANKIEVKKSLIRYDILKEKIYQLKIQSLDDSAIILSEILHDTNEKPMMRYLAAQMLASIPHEDFFQIITKEAQSFTPVGVLCWAAMRQRRIIPPDLHTNSVNWQSWQKKSGDELYSMLLAYYLNPESESRIAKTLLTSKNEHISLLAFANIRRFIGLGPFLTKQDLHKCALQLSNSQNPLIRSYVCRELWNFSLHRISPGQEPSIYLLQQARKSWETYQGLFLRSLQDKSPLVQKAALKSIVSDLFFQKALAYAKTNKTLQEIRKHIHRFYSSKNMNTRYIATLAISATDSAKARKILSNSRESFFIRISAASSGMTGVNIAEFIRTADYFSKSFARQPKTESDRKLRYVALVSIAISPLPIHKQIIQKQVPELLGKEKDPYFRRAILSALSKSNSLGTVNLAKKYFDAKYDLETQIVAVRTMTSIYASKFKVMELENLQRQLQSYPQTVRESAAKGCLNQIAGIIQWLELQSQNPNKQDHSDTHFDAILEYILTSGRSHLLENLIRSAIRISPTAEFYYLLSYVLSCSDQKHNDIPLAIRQAMRSSEDITNWDDSEAEKELFQARCLLQMGIYFLHSGSLKKAETSIQEAIAKYPLHSKFYYYLGKCLEEQKRWKEARLNFEKAYLCKPENNSYKLHIIRSKLKETGNIDKALVEIKKLSQQYIITQNMIRGMEEFEPLYQDSFVLQLPQDY